ncbi:hypothetical protein BC834DRAFT_911560, partial [Gloeopeniophorella convolvens]
RVSEPSGLRITRLRSPIAASARCLGAPSGAHPSTRHSPATLPTGGIDHTSFPPSPDSAGSR